MLFERPNVRVLADPACVRFARAAEGRVAGRLFFGSFLWSEQRNEQFFLRKEGVRKKSLKIFCIFIESALALLLTPTHRCFIVCPSQDLKGAMVT